MREPNGGREPDRYGFIDVNRTRLRLWEWGDPDAPVIVAVHGAHDHGRMWDGLAPRLADDLGYRVVAPDLRGHGDSGRLSSGHVWMATTLDLGLLAREVGAGEPIRFVGHSFGAGLSMYTAGVWPSLVRWVVNLDGLGPPIDGDPSERDLTTDASRSFASAERALLGDGRRYATREEMVERRAGVNVRLPRAWIEHLVDHGSIEDADGWRWKADPLFNVGFPGDWDVEGMEAEHGLVECPLLVVTGAEPDTWSDLAPGELAIRLGHFRDARHVEIPGAGHYVHVEAPDAVLEAIASFVDEVGR
ncbi:MAG: alpha/beta hydrolase [Actinomycetota bacterium]|nr:alpha/beta hydrolase [Actinomycetota bacterium]